MPGGDDSAQLLKLHRRLLAGDRIASEEVVTLLLASLTQEVSTRGPLMDRTKEHLASSDAAIIQVRRRLIGAARALAEGKEPEAPWHPEAYAYHSARLVVDADTPVEQAVAEVEALAMQKSGQASMLVRGQLQVTFSGSAILPSALSLWERALGNSCVIADTRPRAFKSAADRKAWSIASATCTRGMPRPAAMISWTAW